jgi:uncharacterized membrane protein
VNAAARTALEFVTFAAAGWAVENVANLPDPPRYSPLFGGARLPLLPVYGIGGLLTLQTMKRMRKHRIPAVYRAVVYAASSAALEYVTCHLDRWVGFRSWDYTGDPTADRDGCVDLKHSAAWALLAFAVEQLV